jgi:predicted esterase
MSSQSTTGRRLARQRHKVLALAVLALAMGPPALAQAEAFPSGGMVEHVSCLSAPDLTYALYLPGSYDSSRKWPLLIIMDPRGRAPMALELFREGAEKFGLLLMSSYDTRSDVPRDRNIEAVKAMLPDAEQRFSLDTNRIYLAGFSGTARTAWVLASALRPHVAGIIGIGGGLPGQFDPKGVPISFFGGAGATDFNYEEMRELDASLDRTGIPHRFVVWEGGHSWAPAETAGRALEWMRLQAMKKGRVARDPEWVAEFFQRRLQEAATLEKDGRLPEAFEIYRGVEEDFEGLVELGDVPAITRKLERSKELRRHRSQESRFAAEYRRYRQAFWDHVEEVQALEEMRGEQVPGFLRLESLQARAEQGEDPADADAAQRILAMLAVQTSFYLPSTFLEEGSPEKALAMLRIAAAVRPESPRVCLQQARAYAQMGKKEPALKSLRCAVDSGLVPRQMLEEDPYLAPLREDPAFQAALPGG